MRQSRRPPKTASSMCGGTRRLALTILLASPRLVRTMRTYLYISDAKVDMYLSQIDKPQKRRIARTVGVDLLAPPYVRFAVDFNH